MQSFFCNQMFKASFQFPLTALICNAERENNSISKAFPLQHTHHVIPSPETIADVARLAGLSSEIQLVTAMVSLSGLQQLSSAAGYKSLSKRTYFYGKSISRWPLNKPFSLFQVAGVRRRANCQKSSNPCARSGTLERLALFLTRIRIMGLNSKTLALDRSHGDCRR